MRRGFLSTAIILSIALSISMTSCIGSFGLTNSVMKWNNQVGGKFVNELVFVAFWILPVYEVTGLADILVINSIEFWSGSNPITSSTKAIDTDQGRYLVDCDGKGYTIKFQPTGQTWRFDFDADSRTWAFNNNGTLYPFMTFVDDSHVKMITPEGDFRQIDLSEEGVLAYQTIASQKLQAMAIR